MNYKLVIFDFDGTLADTLPWFAGLLNEIADRYGFKRVEPHEYDTLRGFTPKEISEYLGVPLWKAPLIGADLRRRMAHDIDRISLYPGMEQALRELWDGGATLAVVSSNAETNVRTVLGREIAALIDDYECGVSLFGKAPKLRKVIDHTGVGRDETIYIGDEIRDLEAARLAGIAFGAVTWGYNSASALEAHGPDVILAAVDELPGKLC